MATGTGLNMRGAVKRGGYGATDRGARAGTRAAMASRSSRRAAGSSVSGQPCRHWRRPSPSRHRRKARWPRHWSCRLCTGSPSTVAGASLAGITILEPGRPSSRFASQPPCRTARSATGTDAGQGSSDAMTAIAASTPNTSNAAARRREGRHSRRQGADAFDQDLEFVIVGDFVAHEPVPQPIVLGFQKP